MRRFQFLGTSAASRAMVLASLAFCSTALTPLRAEAKDVYLAAVRTCVDKTGATAGACATGGTATAIPVWSFVSISSAEFGAKALLPATLASAVVPGPMLNVDSSDTSGLTIHLLNLLPVPTSIIIPGQPAALVPTWFNAATGTVTGTGSRPAGDTKSRVRSLNTETAAGATGTYTWSTIKPGSFIYESATHQGIQVQMGLHGGLIVASGTTTPGETTASYAGATYSGQVTTYLSEIDSAMHRTVDASPTFDATPAGSASKFSPLEYWPDVFLTTQLMLTPDFSAVTPIAGHSQVAVNSPTMMRFFNSSLRSHDQVVQDENLALVAEDGNPYRYPKYQYSVLLDAGKTKDALMIPAVIETVAVYDRMLNTGGIGATQAGMVAYLDIASPSTPTAANDSYTTPQGVALVVPTKGVLANDVSHDGQTLTAQLVTGTANGTLALAADGSFTYTPKAGSTATTDAFAYKAAETVNGTTYTSKQATATITLTAVKPVAAPDIYYVTNNTNGVATLTVAAPGVLANDVPASGLTAKLVTGPTKGTLTQTLGSTGGFTYKSTNTFIGADSFTYTATSTTAGTSAPATVTINVLAIPVAASDAFNVVHGSTGNILNVLSNDTGCKPGAAVVISTQPSRGSVVANADGTMTYSNTSTRAGQNDSIRYHCVNLANTSSNTATVTITVN